MGVTKTENFTEEQNQIALYAKVLGHPARIAILQELLKRNECICGDLVLELNLAQATVSQHLKELKNTGIIQGSIEGTKVCYCINPEKWADVKDMFVNFFKGLPDGTNCC